MIHIYRDDIFHVHSFRCGHAEEIPDRAYIEKAIELGSKGIWFTDHAPFPGNPFKREHRMLYEDLPEYLDTLSRLKDDYRGKIEVHIGLETEYFDKFRKMGYYDELKKLSQLDVLLLGQHMAELPEGGYSYDWGKEKLIEAEYKVLGEAMIEGIKSGYFSVVAHPDRIFRRRKVWDDDMNTMAERIISAAAAAGLPLEQNESSKSVENYYREEFWNLAIGKVDTVRGLDAHFLNELRLVNH